MTIEDLKGLISKHGGMLHMGEPDGYILGSAPRDAEENFVLFRLKRRSLLDFGSKVAFTIEGILMKSKTLEEIIEKFPHFLTFNWEPAMDYIRAGAPISDEKLEELEQQQRRKLHPRPSMN